jgi:SAM-dependent methyltransferase
LIKPALPTPSPFREVSAPPRESTFEFDALREADYYRATIVREFLPYLEGDVLEVGAGIGQLTAAVTALPGIRRVVSLEPDGNFCRNFPRDLPRQQLVQGTACAVAPGSHWNAVVSVNVLEHIAADQQELKIYRQLLSPAAGVLCLFVPARPEIYSELDRDFGHHRRYTRPELEGKLTQAGFRVLRLHYFNLPGYFAWWLSFCLLRKRSFNARAVRWFDRLIFPPAHFLEARLGYPPIGQSLLAAAQAG